jgi:NAD(P)-dependent dehydrogenase (short-subunit alcohol dehydrogenase family)
MRKAVLMAQLAGKIAIVTGGSRGIGAAAGHGIAGDVPPMIRRNDGVPYRRRRADPQIRSFPRLKARPFEGDCTSWMYRCSMGSASVEFGSREASVSFARRSKREPRPRC